MGLDIVEATAIAKMADKRLEELKKQGKKIEPGNYEFDFTLSVDGSLSRGADTEVAPSFRVESLFKAIILQYAQTVTDNPQEWLSKLLGDVLKAVIELKPDAVVKTIDPDLKALYDSLVDEAKQKWKDTVKKVPRAGITTVIGEMQPSAAVR